MPSRDASGPYRPTRRVLTPLALFLLVLASTPTTLVGQPMTAPGRDLALDLVFNPLASYASGGFDLDVDKHVSVGVEIGKPRPANAESEGSSGVTILFDYWKGENLDAWAFGVARRRYWGPDAAAMFKGAFAGFFLGAGYALGEEDNGPLFRSLVRIGFKEMLGNRVVFEPFIAVGGGYSKAFESSIFPQYEAGINVGLRIASPGDGGGEPANR